MVVTRGFCDHHRAHLWRLRLRQSGSVCSPSRRIKLERGGHQHAVHGKGRRQAFMMD